METGLISQRQFSLNVNVWQVGILDVVLSEYLDKSYNSIACVADALNLLYTDYTNDLDECVGRLQRRLIISQI